MNLSFACRSKAEQKNKFPSEHLRYARCTKNGSGAHGNSGFLVKPGTIANIMYVQQPGVWMSKSFYLRTTNGHGGQFAGSRAWHSPDSYRDHLPSPPKPAAAHTLDRWRQCPRDRTVTKIQLTTNETMEKVLEHVSNRLMDEGLRHEIHKFDSGAVMVDIWKDDLFYVVQIEDERIGLSLIDEANPGFDTIPDKSYDTLDKFIIDFEKIFQSV